MLAERFLAVPAGITEICLFVLDLNFFSFLGGALQMECMDGKQKVGAAVSSVFKVSLLFERN